MIANKNDIPSILSTMLQETGMTQAELAHKAHMTEVSISRYMHGIREPKHSDLIKLVNACGYEIVIKER